MNNELEKRVEVLEQRLKEIENKLSGNNARTITESKKVSIKEFLITKKIDDDVKRTLVLTYFLEHMENYKSINTDDLKKAFSLAKHPLPSNINDKVNMNIKNAHMMESDEKKDGKKAWVLTATGEKFVESELNE
jgi:hypothetical protein